MESNRNGSITPNSMMVLERGSSGASTLVGPSSRPPSGRRSRNLTPIQRSGSQLEVLPPDDEKSAVRESSKTSNRPSSREATRRTHSAGSSGQRSQEGQEKSDKGMGRASSMEEGISPREKAAGRPGSGIHKQVSLTTVKRDYEKHGIPKNEQWDFIPKDVSDSVLTPVTNGTSSANELKSRTDGASEPPPGIEVREEGRAVGGGNGDGASVLSEKECAEQRLRDLMEQLSVKNAEIQQAEERRSATGSSREERQKERSRMVTDSYYVSTGNVAETQPVTEPSERGPRVPPFLEDEKEETEQGAGKEEEEEDDDEEEEGEEEEEEEGPTAPIELMGEFLDAVMEQEYETADKLCKMILIYEPENAECLQFKPLIEEMLKKVWQRQLWGSSSEDSDDEGDEDDDDDDDDDDDEDDDEEGEDSDEEESSESDSSEESSEEEEDEEEEGPTVIIPELP